MDALKLLTADHNRVRGLFARFTQVEESGDTAAMGSLCEEAFRELAVHTSIEEDIFYPAVRDAGEQFDELVNESVEEHHVVKVLMDEIAGVEVGSEPFVAKMQVLMENVEHHAGEEEQELFPGVRSAMGTDALVALGERLDAGKGERGAPTLAAREGLTLEQLRELASAQEIPGRSSMDREELAATVSPA
jgi:hemerythrin superfamily protein